MQSNKQLCCVACGSISSRHLLIYIHLCSSLCRIYTYVVTYQISWNCIALLCACIQLLYMGPVFCLMGPGSTDAIPDHTCRHAAYSLLRRIKCLHYNGSFKNAFSDNGCFPKWCCLATQRFPNWFLQMLKTNLTPQILQCSLFQERRTHAVFSKGLSNHCRG